MESGVALKRGSGSAIVEWRGPAKGSGSDSVESGGALRRCSGSAIVANGGVPAKGVARVLKTGCLIVIFRFTLPIGTCSHP